MQVTGQTSQGNDVAKAANANANKDSIKAAQQRNMDKKGDEEIRTMRSEIDSIQQANQQKKSPEDEKISDQQAKRIANGLVQAIGDKRAGKQTTAMNTIVEMMLD